MSPAKIVAICLLTCLAASLPEWAVAQILREHSGEDAVRGFHGATPFAAPISRSFKSDDEAKIELDRILTAVGLNWIGDRISLRVSDQTANASAGISLKGERFIFYNATFMQELKQKTTEQWSLVSILAHEVGHHLAYHTIVDGRWHEFELEADYFSGFVLRRLGATLPQSHSAMRAINPKEATLTHPALEQRLQVITVGWTDGGGKAGPAGVKLQPSTSAPPTGTSPIAQPTAPAAPVAPPAAPKVESPAATPIVPAPAPEKVASAPPVKPPVLEAPKETVSTSSELARAIQEALIAHGCLSGEAEGGWGRRSREALAAFYEKAKLGVPPEAPDRIVLAAVTRIPVRVCPLVCQVGYIIKDEKCFKQDGSGTKSAGSDKPLGRPPQGQPPIANRPDKNQERSKPAERPAAVKPAGAARATDGLPFCTKEYVGVNRCRRRSTGEVCDRTLRSGGYFWDCHKQ